MKKLLILTAVCLSFVACTAHSASLDERIAKVEAKYEQKLQKIDNSRYTDARKSMLKQHAEQNKDLKIKQMKELDSLKKKSPKKNTKKSK